MRLIKNVLTIANICPTKYGSFERYCIHLSQHLADAGITHYVIFPVKPSNKVLKKLEQARAKVYVKDLKFLRIFESLWLLKFIYRWRIDVVHSHFYSVLSAFSFFVIFSPAQYFITYHISGPALNADLVRKTFRRIRGYLLGIGVTKIFCVSQHSYRKLSLDYCLDKKKATVLYNGVSLDDFKEKQWDHEENNNALNVICVAHLIEDKGIQHAIEAIRLMVKDGYQVTLQLVGEGAYGKQLEWLVQENKLTNQVAFLGSRDDVSGLLTGADLVIVPSVWEEAFGYVIIEAMAAGVPVLASKIGGIPEIIEDGVTGLLVEPGNAEALKEGMQSLLQNRIKLAQMGCAGRACVANSFSMERLLARQLSEYRREETIEPQRQASQEMCQEVVLIEPNTNQRLPS